MILLLGIPSEPPIRLVCEAADEAGVDYTFFNQREVVHTAVRLDVGDGPLRGSLHLRGVEHPLQRFDGVYARCMDPGDVPEVGRFAPDTDRGVILERARAVQAALTVWMERAGGRILNPVSAMGSNFSKPYQALMIEAAGLATPPTLITNSPDRARAFLERHRRVIYKSTSSIRSIVRELRAGEEADLHDVHHLPTQFQAFVPGRDVRVHVVGDEVFPTEIRSEAVDYRYAGRDDLEVDMTPTELPEAVRDACLRLSRDLRLPLCGIDLRLTPEGMYVCFEVNPSPAYSYYQEHTGQPIAAAIVRHLAGARSSAACAR